MGSVSCFGTSKNYVAECLIHVVWLRKHLKVCNGLSLVGWND